MRHRFAGILSIFFLLLVSEPALAGGHNSYLLDFGKSLKLELS